MREQNELMSLVGTNRDANWPPPVVRFDIYLPPDNVPAPHVDARPFPLPVTGETADRSTLEEPGLAAFGVYE
jgi:hypothetical protein